MVDTAWNEARYVFLAEYVLETRRKAGGCLNSRVGNFSTVVGKVETENSFKRVEIDVLLESNYVIVHLSHVLRVDKYEGPLRIEIHRKNVFDIFVCELCEFRNILAFLVEELLIVCYLNYERHLEGLLEILTKNKWKHMPKV